MNTEVCLILIKNGFSDNWLEENSFHLVLWIILLICGVELFKSQIS